MATKYWSGTGTWSAAGANWATSPGGPYNTTFNADDDAVFEGTAGTVTVDAPNSEKSITFNVTGYTLSGGSFAATPSREFKVTVGSGISATISSVIAGSRWLNKYGAGTLTLSGANTYTDWTTIREGTLKLGASSTSSTSGPLGNTAGTVIRSDHTIDLNGYSLTDQALEPFYLTGTGVGGNGALINSSATPATIAGLINLDGNTSIVANNGNIILSNAGTITGSGYNLTLGGTATGCSLASIIGIGTGTLTKEGTGTWTLSGANTYTGATTINAGTLLVNGNQSSASGAVTVSSGATLGGTGTIGGAVTINDGGTIAPGSSSAATLTISKASATALALNSTSVLTYTLGTAQDKIVLSGASSNLTLDGTINVTAGAGFVGGVFDLITYNGTLTNNTLAIGTLPSGYNGAINVDTTLKKIQIVLTGGIVAMREYPRGVGRGIMRGII